MSRRDWKLIAILVVLLGAGLPIVTAAAFVLLMILDPSSPIAAPVAVEARVDPTLDRADGVHPAGLLNWKANQLNVFSSRGKDGSLFFATHRSSGSDRTERVEITIVLDPPGLRANVAARSYKNGSIVFFTGNENAEDLHGVVLVDAARPPSPGDDRIVTYDLEGLRAGKPVHFSGKIIAGAGELDTVQSDMSAFTRSLSERRRSAVR
jgi:hypothetical protein